MATGASSGTKEATCSRCPAEISGPICVDSSSGSPTRSASTCSSSASMNASYAERSTRIRERAQQSWPALPKTAYGACAAARSRSASAKTTFADFPPSSSVTRLIVPAAACITPRPTSVEPVKPTFATSRCSAFGGAGGAPHPPAPPPRGAGEPALRAARVPGGPLPDDRPRADDDVQAALGNPRLDRELAEPHRRQRRQLGRLQDHGIAAG